MLTSGCLANDAEDLICHVLDRTLAASPNSNKSQAHIRNWRAWFRSTVLQHMSERKLHNAGSSYAMRQHVAKPGRRRRRRNGRLNGGETNAADRTDTACARQGFSSSPLQDQDRQGSNGSSAAGQEGVGPGVCPVGSAVIADGKHAGTSDVDVTALLMPARLQGAALVSILTAHADWAGLGHFHAYAVGFIEASACHKPDASHTHEMWHFIAPEFAVSCCHGYAAATCTSASGSAALFDIELEKQRGFLERCDRLCSPPAI